MGENTRRNNNSVRMPLNDEQISFVTGGMYHGYARSDGNGMIAGMPPHGPGALGPGMGYAPKYVGPQYQNPMKAPGMQPKPITDMQEYQLYLLNHSF